VATTIQWQTAATANIGDKNSYNNQPAKKNSSNNCMRPTNSRKTATINQKQEMDVKIQKSLIIFSFKKFYSEAVTQICYAEREREHAQ